MPAATDPVKGDPLLTFLFVVDFGDKLKNVAFTEVGGISKEFEVVEHKVMTSKGSQIVRKIPGRTKWGELTLKRGITTNMDVYKWRKMVEDGAVDKARTNGTITMFDQTLKPAAKWNVEAAWPSKINGPSFKADGNDVATEEITVVYEHIERTM